MREIKLRAWLKNFRLYDGEAPMIYDWQSSLHVDDLGFQPPGVPIMQYTGLKDKNGKEIYESDVIKAPGEFPAEIKFSGGSFCLNHISDVIGSWVSLRDVSTKSYEVIGNIYENPELLEK